jgi:Transport and Golgi organisation 2
VHFIAPADGDHGGSWIGVNQFGLALCLLNRYTDQQMNNARTYRSRGLLLNSLLDCRSRAQFATRIQRARLARYQPFTLLALSPGEPAMIAQWDGSLRAIERFGEPAMPLVSSAYRPAEVAATRRRLFWQMAAEQGRLTSDVLRAFHQSHEPARGPLSPCMHRADAATVSFSHIKVSEQLIEFTYHAEAPCAENTPDLVVLSRADEPLPQRRAVNSSDKCFHTGRAAAPRLSFI